VKVDRALALQSWLTKKETAAALGVSEKTVERLAVRGKLEQRLRLSDGARSVVVYNPANIEALRTTSVAVLPPETPGSTVVYKPQPAAPSFDAVGYQLARLVDLAVRVSDRVSDRVELSVYVSMKVAIPLTGLSRGMLLELADAGKIKRYPFGRGWRYRRADLEAL